MKKILLMLSAALMLVFASLSFAAEGEMGIGMEAGQEPEMASATGSVVASKGYMVFDTPGSHTWLVPEGVTQIWVSAAGGGGGGSGAGKNTRNGPASYMRLGAGGGGGASFVKCGFSVEPGQLLFIECGKGGKGGEKGGLSALAGAGENGGSTFINGLFTLSGGFAPSRGYGYEHSPAVGGAPGGVGGQPGEAGYLVTNYQPSQYGDLYVRGNGGGTLLGFGGIISAPEHKPMYGGGGAGGALLNDSNTFYDGGDGADGVVIIEW